MDVNARYMDRALQLAGNGEGYVSPNPMVGAVVVCDGRIIGEGWHRRYGEGHAEVNALRSVKDESLLPRSTMYVTLEPCSHYGKTPPCAKLLIDKKVGAVVVATLDPFEKVSGRGVAMLREAGIEVVTGVREEQARLLNRRFFTAHTLHRPYVMLKWAQSADGFIDRRRTGSEPAEKFSTAEGQQLVHALRAGFDAIVVGSGTVLADNPRLDVRSVVGRNPRPVVFDRSGRIESSSNVLMRSDTIYCGPVRDDLKCEILPSHAGDSLIALLEELYRKGITSLLVEGGKRLLDSFIASNLWNDCRVEISRRALGDCGEHRMVIPEGRVEMVESGCDSTIIMVCND